MSNVQGQSPSLAVWILFGLLATAVVFGIGWWMQQPAKAPVSTAPAVQLQPAVDPFAAAASGPQVTGQSGFSLGPAPAPITSPAVTPASSPAIAASAANQPR